MNSSEEAITMVEYLEDQQKCYSYADTELKKKSARQCTRKKGYCKQELFGCQTCNITQGFCRACYLNCHYDHETFKIGVRFSSRCKCKEAGPCQLENHTANIETNSYPSVRSFDELGWQQFKTLKPDLQLKLSGEFRHLSDEMKNYLRTIPKEVVVTGKHITDFFESFYQAQDQRKLRSYMLN